MATTNSNEPQSIPGEPGLWKDGEMLTPVAPKPIAAISGEGALDAGATIPVVPGPIASAPEGVVPEDQQALIDEANTRPPTVSKSAAKKADDEEKK